MVHAHVAAVGAARRPRAGALALDPITHPAAAAPPAPRGAAGDGRRRTRSPPRRRRRPTRRRCRRTLFYPEASQRSYYIDALLKQLTNPNPSMPSDPANVLGTTRAAAQATASTRAACGSTPTTTRRCSTRPSLAIAEHHSRRTSRSSPPRSSSIDNTQRRRARGRVRARLRREPVRSRGRRPGPPGRIVVQGHHARGRAVGRLLARRPGERRLAAAGGSGPGSGSDAFYNLSGDCHGGDPTLTEAIAISDNCAFVRTELSLGPGHYGHDGARQVIDDGEPHGHRHVALPAGRVDDARHQRRAPARDGAGLLGDRRPTVCCTRRSSSRRSSGRPARCCTRAPTHGHAGAHARGRAHRDRRCSPRC